MVEDISVVVNVMLSLMSVMSPPPALCNLSVRTAVKLCILVTEMVVWGVEEVSAGHVDGTRGLGNVSSAADVLGVHVVRERR